MESKWQKVFVACAFGAFIGSIVALQLNGYFWWVGLIAGGFVGYITYEFEVVLKAIPKVWKAMIGWRLNVEYWKAFGKLSVYLTIIISTITVPVAMFLLVLGDYTNSINIILVTPLIGLLETMLVLGLSRGKYQSLTQNARDFARYNAITVFFWYLPKAVLKATGWLLRHGIPGAAVATARFGWHVFKLVHSDERLLCGVDAAIGAAVGYFTGNALIGALSGGIFGVASFELLSKRLLHLIPAKRV